MHGQNLINGDFETGSLPPWTTNGWVVDTVNPHGGRYCAWDTGGHWIRQDIEPRRNSLITFHARQPEQPGGMTLEMLYTDSTVRQVFYQPGSAWTEYWQDTLFDPRKQLCGLRFRGRQGGPAGDTTYIDDVMLLQGGDLGVAGVLSPTGDSFWVGQRIAVGATFRNYGTTPMTCWAWAHFWHEAVPDEYWDSAWVSLNEGRSRDVWFRDWIPQFAGWYRFFISGDPCCTTYRRVLVLDSSGVAERDFVQPARTTRLPTVLTPLHPVLARGRSTVTVRDASGAMVWNSRTDGAALSPGVYFTEANGRIDRIVIVR